VTIDPGGISKGRRIRSCSNLAQLHFVYNLPFVDGFGRLEIDWHRIMATVYCSFNPPPPWEEYMTLVREWEQAYLVFLYEVDGQMWLQFDVKPNWLPRYKTATDKQSPAPPEPEFSNWKKAYRAQNKALPKSSVKTNEGVREALAKPSQAVTEDSQSVAETFRTSRDELSCIELSRDELERETVAQRSAEPFTVDVARFEADYPIAVSPFEVQLLRSKINSRQDQERLFASLDAHKTSPRWQDAKFVPSARRFLAEDMWRTLPKNGTQSGATVEAETPLWRPEDHL
jgi:hypothetical protein